MSRVPRTVTTVSSFIPDFVDRSEYAEWFTDCFDSGQFGTELGTFAAGSSGSVAYNTIEAEVIPNKPPAYGIAALSLTGTAATVVNCRASLITIRGGTNQNTPVGAMQFGKGAMVFEARVKAVDASGNFFAQGSGDYTRFGVGFMRWHAPGAPGYLDNVIGFVRTDSNGTGNYPAQPGVWHTAICNNHQSTIRTSYQATTASLSDWNTLRVEISPTADQVDFFVNGTLVRTALRKDLGLAMPASSDMIWPGDGLAWTDQPYTHGTVQLRNNAVASNHLLYCDYALCRIETPKRRLG